jgi:hypothetical protein
MLGEKDVSPWEIGFIDSNKKMAGCLNADDSIRQNGFGVM